MKKWTIAALGLTLAVCLILAFPWLSEPDKGARFCQIGDQVCAEHYKNSDGARFWVYPFYGTVYAEDTLAQWVMACMSVLATIFSMYAIFVVRDTLKQAIESNKIAEADQRPWLILSIDCKHVDMVGDKFAASGDFIIENVGRRAAHVVAGVKAYSFGPSIPENHRNAVEWTRSADTNFYVMPGQKVTRLLIFEPAPLDGPFAYMTGVASYKWGDERGLTSITWSAAHLRPDGSVGPFTPHGAYESEEIQIKEVHELSVVE